MSVLLRIYHVFYSLQDDWLYYIMFSTSNIDKEKLNVCVFRTKEKRVLKLARMIHRLEMESE